MLVNLHNFASVGQMMVPWRCYVSAYIQFKRQRFPLQTDALRFNALKYVAIDR